MISALFYIAGAATVGIFFTLWCVVSVERVKKEYEASRYGILCDRIQEQIDEIRLRIAVTKTQLHMSDHTLDQALLQWKYEYLVKQECSISTYYKILDAELYDFDDGYMQLNVDIDTKNIDLEEYVSMQKKSIADMCNVSEEKVIPISRLEYETYTDE